ncbi:MAG: 30S ribosomal protein S17 [Patescibacteria group bacterium]
MITKHIQKLKGTVVSAKMQKTVVVEVARLKKHPKYHKFMRVSKRYKAHIEDNSLKEGDKVILMPIPRMSRDKRWTAVKQTT